ncbi:MAG TPA: hypothetical protein VFP54_09040 [Acidimicrobiales bacterium]|nr:hypothetical protein [Acidimicrobiales bacterium]
MGAGADGAGTAAKPLRRADAALRDLHESLWDPGVDLVWAPDGMWGPSAGGARTPLHSVRESALGALCDLNAGRVERARRAVVSVLSRQYRTREQPWSGTFKVFAEQPDPPGERAVEWIHFDPNWRQFLGCILAYVAERHAPSLGPELTTEIEAAAARAVHGEPDGRIPRWYTNPGLLHAWLSAWVGTRTGDGAALDRGLRRLDVAMDRLERYGDVDEYNSPTYDGIDLIAVGLWAAIPPVARFAEAAAVLGTRLGERMSILYHPGLGAICGPHVRAYGVDLRSYVSLAGAWLAAAGAAGTLPEMLDRRTDHVHDLYFVPLITDLAPAVLPFLQIRPVDRRRSHTQRFGAVEATSVLLADRAVGGETGRRPVFARGQYLPAVAHFRWGEQVVSVSTASADEGTTCDGVATSEGALAVSIRATDRCRATLDCSHHPVVDGGVVRVGPVTVTASAAPSRFAATPVAGRFRLALEWAGPGADLLIAGPTAEGIS